MIEFLVRKWRDFKMENKKYTITEAAKMLKVEAHVLRYWEEELGIKIKRNELGHRYYEEKDIALFERIKELKQNGKSLKSIGEAIDMYYKKIENNTNTLDRTEYKKPVMKETKGIIHSDEKSDEMSASDDYEDELNENIVDFKQAQMQKLMSKMIANALQENKHIITSSVKAEVTEEVMKQMDVIMREKEEREEARFRKLDECLRRLQRSNDEVAATRIKKRWRSKR